MSETTLVILGLVLAVWCLWLEYKVRTLQYEVYCLCDTLVGLAKGTRTIKMDGKDKVKVEVIGL
jgi:hypothetical protein